MADDVTKPTYDEILDALHEIVTNGRWSEGEQCGEWCVSKDVYDEAYNLSLVARAREG